MKFFKTLKRKVGNAILPVVGTILGLTILAGTVVGVALHSSKMVYRQDNLEKQNDARQILYIASKYFCTELNNGRSANDIAKDLKGFFGDGLKVTQDKTDLEKYYIWYPNRYKTGNEYTTDENVAEWLKATIKKVEGDDENGDHGNTGINDTLFKEEAKLDEKFAVGNMMTVYLTDNRLLPGRRYSINEVSLVESDIDTFDEAFTYMNNTGVLEIDDIQVALYKYGVVRNNSTTVNYQVIDNDNKYEIIYKTGNLGGNYYWQDSKGTDYDTKLYRQEYDLDLLWDMVLHENRSIANRISRSDFKYEYNEENDTHILYSNKPSDEYRVVYNSSQEFAEALTEIVFWKNLTRLSLNLSDVKQVIQDAATDFVKNRPDLVDQFRRAFDWTYEWKNSSLTVFVHWTDKYNKNWYSEADFNDAQIINLYQTNSTLKNKYCDTDGTLNYYKLYNALLAAGKKTYMSSNESAINAVYNAIVKKLILTEKSVATPRKNAPSNYILEEYAYTSGGIFGIGGTKYYYYYTWNNNWFLDNTQNSRPAALEDAVKEFITKRLNIKYVTGEEGKDPVDVGGYSVVDEIQQEGLTAFQYFTDDICKITYHFMANVRKSPTQVDPTDFFSEQTGDDIIFKADGVYQGTQKILSYSGCKTGRDTFVKTFILAFASICNVNTGNLYSEEEINTKVHEQLKKDLVDPDTFPIMYQYLPTSTLNEILGTNSTTIPGMKQEAINNKLITYYLENTTFKDDVDLKNNIKNNNLDFEIDIKSASYATSTTATAGYLDYRINFEVKVEGVRDPYKRTVSFLIKYVTLSPLNTMKLVDGEYEIVENGNARAVEDNDGSTKYLFTPVTIYNTNEEDLTKNDIQSNKIPSILTAIPYKERTDSNQVVYGNHKITIDGTDYTVTTNINDLKDVSTNLLFDGNITNLPTDDFTIKVEKDKSLFINGKLLLNKNQQIDLKENSLLYVNGDMRIEYDIRVKMGQVGRTYYARQLTADDISSFKSQGVDVHAEKDAKIMINGNFDYRGYKAKVAEASGNGYITIWNDPYESSLDRVFEQYVLSTGFIQKENDEKACEKNSSGQWNHYEYECRGLLEGIYIINGDLVFHAWDEEHAQSNEGKQVYAMYRNMYSNPLINGTFYIDGKFDMRGLYTSGLYDQCRANFIFAKSIIEPAIALNTILCAGPDTKYGAWDDTDGYLFMICEEAIDFSEANFACVNLFTPFQELVKAINANKESETNFSDFIKKDAFLALYPNKKVIDEWGLPSILKTGFAEFYNPGDIGSIKAENQFNSNGDPELGNN